jgi:DNA-binding NarL/FixJ family response regulator
VSGRVRLLISDDHPVVRAGLKGMLAGEPDFEVVGEATDGLEALELAERLEPDVVLMDLRMPRMDGVRATRRVRDKLPDTRVLILTTYETDADVVKALEAGATGYLLKDASSEDLYRAIRAAAANESALAPAVVSRLVRRMHHSEEESLSAREIEVLELVARGTSNKEIARELWISETTVKSHLLHAFEKLGVSDRTAAVTEAIRRKIIDLGH